MDPNHRDRVAFVRLCSGRFRRGMKLKQSGTEQAASRAQSDPVLRAGARNGGRSLARRHHRHSEPRRLARRRHAERERSARLHRHSQFRAGDSAARALERCDEGEAPEARAREPRGGGRDAGVPAADRRAMDRGRGRQSPARRAEEPAAGGIRARRRSRSLALRDRALGRRHAGGRREIPRREQGPDGGRPRRRAWCSWPRAIGSWAMSAASSPTSDSSRPANAAAPPKRRKRCGGRPPSSQSRRRPCQLVWLSCRARRQT